MSLIELKFLFLIQIGVDFLIVLFFVFLIRRIKPIGKSPSLDKPAQIFASLLRDADSLAGQLQRNLEEKQHLMKRLNEQLDRRITSLNVLLNRADALLPSNAGKTQMAGREPVSVSEKQSQVIGLAKKGHRAEKIADILSISKGEVRLVLDLKKKLSQMGAKESGSR